MLEDSPSVLRVDTPERNQFGTALTAHMVTATWDRRGWSAPALANRDAALFGPAAVGLHYGQIVFEGLKAYRLASGGLALFRPLDHAGRLQRSAARMAMQVPPVDLFLESLDLLAAADGPTLSDDPRLSLYLRPILIASEQTLALRPSREYTFVVLAFVTEQFFGTNTVTAWVTTRYARAFPGGTGDTKCPGNYAPGFLAQAEAAANDCQQVIWLDAVDHLAVEEMGGMNLFFVHDGPGTPTLTTPPLTGTILPGITRESLLTIGTSLGYHMREAGITLDEWRTGCRSGTITETIACGTAADVTSVTRVHTDTGEEWPVGDGTAGRVAQRLSQRLRALQRGTVADRWQWRRVVPERDVVGVPGGTGRATVAQDPSEDA